MNSDSLFADSIAFVFLLFILLTLVTVTLGILRFLQLYAHASSQNHPTHLSSENTNTIPPQDRPVENNESSSLALDYVKRNFFGDTADTLENKA
ncbi:hypothetical protein [Paenibacillus durus]|uniref:Uncharacterized protein n=1 Tax=Paenibacillus durus ATCC 35681 TaxID=1333534 RepID=A0A0F7FCZ4_PAEDU|nr:hypothetical protein [Paenibacillus durus]AKG36275.1 hypothetical protein VK70_18340 [Paenibacillus durus ATCC 35681]